MPDPEPFDLAIIGSGPGGYRAAVLAAQRGLRVAVIEGGTWGGTCLNRGCVPKKAWHHQAQLLFSLRRLAGRGLGGDTAPRIDEAWRHQRGVVEQVRASYLDLLSRLGVTAYSGHARFDAPNTLLLVDGTPIRARHVIVATGSRPAYPAPLAPVPGRVISTDELFDALPPPGRRVAVAGSGVIGSEFAFILAMLGLDVTWVCGGRPLAAARFSTSAQRILDDELRQAGVTPRIGARIADVAIGADGLRLTLADGSAHSVDWVLAASGRRPNSDALGLREMGVAVDADGFIRVDAEQRSSLPHVYAIGDVASREMTANQALAQARVAVDNIVAPGTAGHDAHAVPFVVYSAAVLARIGITEDEAEDLGREPAVGYSSFEANPRALGQGDSAGFVRLVADHDSGALLGAEIAGSEAGELIQIVSEAYGADDALRRLATLRYNHPARAEEILNAVEALAGAWHLADRIY